MGGDVNPDRLAARAARLDAFAQHLADELDAFVRQEAKKLRDEYPRAGLSIGKRDSPGPDELAYSVEVITIEPREDGDGTRSVTLDVTAKITGTAAFAARHERYREARRDAARFRRQAAATENEHGDPMQTTIGEYL